MRTLSTIALVAVSAAAVKLTTYVKEDKEDFSPLKTSLEAAVAAKTKLTSKVEKDALKARKESPPVKATDLLKARIAKKQGLFNDPAITWSKNTSVWLINNYSKTESWTLNKEDALTPRDGKPHMMR